MTDKETFRHVIGHFASGVTVLTARNGDADFGATASAVSSLSLEPPMLLVCLNTRSSTQQAIHSSRTFGVNILDEDQGIVAERFASPHGQKFEGLNLERGEGGVPLLADSLAYCECRVSEDVLAGTHRVFLAGVTRAVAREGSPLTYFRGKFGRFEVEQDRIVYGDLRDRILSRSFSLEDSLDVGMLSKELDVLPATVYHAVTKLVADGLLARDPDRGYVVRPVTPESSEHAFDARCAMELGAAAMTVGQVPRQRIAVLRALMEETVPLVSDGRFVDIEAYTRHNEAFHNALVDLADNPALADPYRRLGVAGLMVSLLREGSEAHAEIIDDHRAIVDAYERGSLLDAVAVIKRHNENAKENTRRAIVAAGGVI
ncbi:flavin reductase [Pseudonocardia charpentierae]|uniref:Flavin reductase n=1 Tax=Pseudonocardia charpentierae TaxID=3075545 RepID=A0ABU2NEL8_9PSEU|nr:flavin reductase [Pseudonocardia sp. DSM 45834]MDT0352402.1 flavin reductase [Pseudonocardia sp. DSM 45834]